MGFLGKPEDAKFAVVVNKLWLGPFGYNEAQYIAKAIGGTIQPW